jgi:hypothetical protein
MKQFEYKWIAHRGERYQQTVGVGFFTKKEADKFRISENKNFHSGYIVSKISDVKNPKLN